ncbi:MAG: hypothetical protein FWH26_00950 [Oscillospiraceae bacterium]|nr:hypothetical protein [Oscillospiraceae bacterium]
MDAATIFAADVTAARIIRETKITEITEITETVRGRDVELARLKASLEAAERKIDLYAAEIKRLKRAMNN